MSPAPDVRCLQPSADTEVVHAHDGGDYGLEDIPELFQLGEPAVDAAGRACLKLGAREIRELKVLADAYSFDFEPGLIELCLDLHRFAQAHRSAEFVFVEGAVDPGS